MISKIQDIILEYANGDFSRRLTISEAFDEKDIIASGINMLGEELEKKSISKDYFFKILNSIPQIIVVFNLNGEINFINEFALEILINTNDIFKIISDKILIKNKKFNNKFQFEIILNENQLNAKFLSCTITEISHLKTKHYLFVANDITNNKNEELRIIKATLLGQEIERKRLAYDLHDSLGQELSALKMNINAMEYMKSNSTEFKNTLENVHKMLNSTINSVRDISFNLIPGKFEDKDLNSCITQLINQLNLIEGVNIDLKISKKELILKDKNDELFIYRIIQEFLNNSIKYSKAKLIELIIEKKNSQNFIHFILRDNGIGFEMNDIKNTNGINNIKYRLKSLKANYVFQSKLKVGTKLEFEIYD